MKVLEWLRGGKKQGVDKEEVKSSCKKGQLAALKWVLEHGCSLDQEISKAAARGGHLELLKWAIEKGCPSDRELFLRSRQGRSCEGVAVVEREYAY